MAIGIYNDTGSRYANTAVSGMQKRKQSDITQKKVFSSAVTEAEREGEGEFLGITMIPEKGKSTVYGMRAKLSAESTKDNPIVQIISNLNGEKSVYNVEINKVNSENASMLEMFALCSYADKMGQGTGSTFGSFQTLKIYKETAAQNGCTPCVEQKSSAWEMFCNEKINWLDMVAQVCGILQESKDTRILDLFVKGKKLLDMCSKYMPQVNEAEENGQDNSDVDNVETEENSEDYQKFLQEKMAELAVKIQNDDTEPSYQIGQQSFTEEEWDELLENFDAIEEVLRELMRERHEKAKEEQMERKELQKKIEERETILFAESTTCTYPTSNPHDEDIHYITWYTQEGIFCRKTEQVSGYEWTIAFEKKEQYEKVIEFIGQFPYDWNMRFAAHENFWTDFLDEKIEITGFMEFVQDTNKGVPDFSLTVGNSMYVDKEKMQWAKYFNQIKQIPTSSTQSAKWRVEELLVSSGV